MNAECHPERLPSPGIDLESVVGCRMEKHLLATAAERVKKQVKPEHWQMFQSLTCSSTGHRASCPRVTGERGAGLSANIAWGRC